MTILTLALFLALTRLAVVSVKALFQQGAQAHYRLTSGELPPQIG